jgi:hypothetical protein
MTVFIGGSRKITRLDETVRRRLDVMIEQRLPIILGDASGADKAVQRHLADARYPSVEIFCAGGQCRNNLGGWPVRSIAAGHARGFQFFATKDRAMADEATVGLMIWDGTSVGTLLNLGRLLAQGKSVVAYVAPRRAFADLRSRQDLDALMDEHAPDLRPRLEEELATEERSHAVPAQVSLL